MPQTDYRNVLITGASSGIGRAMALWWAKRGSRVYAAARRLPMLETLAEEGKGQIAPVVLDVSKRRATFDAVEALDEKVGGFDLVIANAGVGDLTPAAFAQWELIERVIDVNVHGAAATLSAVIPRMVKRGHGHIAGVSSVAGRLALGANSTYCASKAFLTMFLRAVRIDLRGTHVKVTCIEPGFIASEMTDAFCAHVPRVLMGSAEDAAKVYGKAIVRGAARISWPRSQSISTDLMRLLPNAVYEPAAQLWSRPQVELARRLSSAPRLQPR